MQNTSKTARYTMFGLLYFSQGAILSYFTALNSLYLLSFDLTMSQIGLMGTIALIPFVLKIFLGMLSDRSTYSIWVTANPILFLGLLVQAACLLIVPQINPGPTSGCLWRWLFSCKPEWHYMIPAPMAWPWIPPRKRRKAKFRALWWGGRAMGVVMISAVIGLVGPKHFLERGVLCPGSTQSAAAAPCPARKRVSPPSGTQIRVARF